MRLSLLRREIDCGAVAVDDGITCSRQYIISSAGRGGWAKHMKADKGKTTADHKIMH